MSLPKLKMAHQLDLYEDEEERPLSTPSRVLRDRSVLSYSNSTTPSKRPKRTVVAKLVPKVQNNSLPGFFPVTPAAAGRAFQPETPISGLIPASLAHEGDFVQSAKLALIDIVSGLLSVVLVVGWGFGQALKKLWNFRVARLETGSSDRRSSYWEAFVDMSSKLGSKARDWNITGQWGRAVVSVCGKAARGTLAIIRQLGDFLS
jgi:hypothetical protein